MEGESGISEQSSEKQKNTLKVSIDKEDERNNGDADGQECHGQMG